MRVPRAIGCLPTGTGKGYLCGHLPEALGVNSLLFCAHREELIDQLVMHLSRVVGHENVDREQAGMKARASAKFVVASIPTLAAKGCARAIGLGRDRFGAVVVDEAHHATAATYQDVLEVYGFMARDEAGKRIKAPNPTIPLLGLTATPSRGDKVGLYNVFDEIVYSMSIQSAIRGGWLVPVHAYTVKTRTSLDGVKVSRFGDYDEGQLARAVRAEERTAAVLDAYLKNTPGMKALGFGVDVEHACEMAKYFDDHGVPAKAIYGSRTIDGRKVRLDPRVRRQAFEWFRGTPGAVLFNCGIATEGVDVPSAEVCILARPTLSATLMAQMMGRVTRLAEGSWDYAESVKRGKDRCILLDVTDNVKDLGAQAVTVGDILGSPFRNTEFKGEDVVNTVERQERMLTGGPKILTPVGMIPEALVPEDVTVDTVAELVNLFLGPPVPRGCRLAWQSLADGYRLSLPGSGLMRVHSDSLDRWQAERWTKYAGWEKVVPFSITSQKALKAAEEWYEKTYPENMGLTLKGTRWRSGPPSEKALAFAKRLGIEVAGDGVTAGQVSDAIQVAQEESKCRGVAVA